MSLDLEYEANIQYLFPNSSELRLDINGERRKSPLDSTNGRN